MAVTASARCIKAGSIGNCFINYPLFLRNHRKDRSYILIVSTASTLQSSVLLIFCQLYLSSRNFTTMYYSPSNILFMAILPAVSTSPTLTTRALGDITDWKCMPNNPVISGDSAQSELSTLSTYSPSEGESAPCNLGGPHHQSCQLPTNTTRGVGFCLDMEECPSVVSDSTVLKYLQNFKNECGSTWHDTAETILLNTVGKKCGKLAVYQNISTQMTCGNVPWSTVNAPPPPVESAYGPFYEEADAASAEDEDFDD